MSRFLAAALKSFRQSTLCLALLAVGATTAPVAAQLPSARLDTIFPAGAKAGGEVEVALTGADLDDAGKLYFSHKGITASPKMSEPDAFSKTPKPIANTFVVKVAGNVPAGIYEVRAISRFGISNPRAFVVGTLEELSEVGGNTKRESAMLIEIGKTVNAKADASSIDFYKLTLKKGQNVLFDCWGQRIDSQIDATLTLYDPSGNEIGRVRDTLHRDPVLYTQAPVDGEYTLAVHDFVYSGGASYFYRLTAHTGPFVDFVFPPVGTPGSNGKYTVYGKNLPGGKPIADMILDGRPLESMTTNIALPGDEPSRTNLAIATLAEPHTTVLDGSLFQLKSGNTSSNAITVQFASAPITVESGDNNTPEKAAKINVPSEYVGQFYPRADRDWVQFDAKKGQVFWLEVVSHRMGLDTDPQLIVYKVIKKDDGTEQVSRVTVADDPGAASNTPDMFNMSTRDPRYKLTADADATYRLVIRDLYGDSVANPRHMYRLIVREENPDFRVVAYASPSGDPRRGQMNPGACVIRKGGASQMVVRLQRRDDFKGDVDISVEGLPSGVTCAGATLGGSTERGSLIITADKNVGAWAGPVRVVAKAKINGKDVTRYARGGSLLWATTNANMPLQSRMIRELALAVIDTEEAPAMALVGDGKMVETSLGGKVELPVKLQRSGDFKADVKLDPVSPPTDVKPPSITLKGNTDGKLAFTLTSTRTPPGTYTFYLKGTAKTKYVRNPDAQKNAEATQKEAEQILKDMTEQKKQADEKLKAAREAAGKDKENKGLAEAAKQAEAAAKEADSNMKEAQKRKQAADKAVNDAKNAMKPKDVNVVVMSTPIKLRIDSTPIDVKVQAPGGAVKAGTDVEIPVTLTKKYGFDEDVDMTFERPSGTTGLTPEKLKITKGQTQGKLVVKLAENATPGEHTCKLKGRLRFNNVTLEETISFQLQVAPADKK